MSLFQRGLGDADKPLRQGSESGGGTGQCYGTYHVRARGLSVYFHMWPRFTLRAAWKGGLDSPFIDKEWEALKKSWEKRVALGLSANWGPSGTSESWFYHFSSVCLFVCPVHYFSVHNKGSAGEWRQGMPGVGVRVCRGRRELAPDSCWWGFRISGSPAELWEGPLCWFRSELGAQGLSPPRRLLGHLSPHPSIHSFISCFLSPSWWQNVGVEVQGLIRQGSSLQNVVERRGRCGQRLEYPEVICFLSVNYHGFILKRQYMCMGNNIWTLQKARGPVFSPSLGYCHFVKR